MLKAEYVTENGPITSYVGMEFTRNREARTGFISMKKYTAKVIENFENDFENANGNAVDTPNILGNDSEWYMQPTKSSEVTVMQTRSYRSLIVCLVWMSNNCRSKLAFTVKKLLIHDNNPSRKQFEFAKQMLAYLQGTLDRGITVNRSGRADYLKLERYSDWASDKEARKSTSGVSGVMALIKKNISLRIVRQKSVTMSTIEAEYVALCASTKEALYKRSLLNDLGHPQKEATVVYDDINQARLLDLTKFVDYRTVKFRVSATSRYAQINAFSR